MYGQNRLKRFVSIQTKIYYQRLTNDNKIDFYPIYLFLRTNYKLKKVLCAKENNNNKFI